MKDLAPADGWSVLGAVWSGLEGGREREIREYDVILEGGIHLWDQREKETRRRILSRPTDFVPRQLKGKKVLYESLN